jgi:peroxiredoxin
MMRATLGPVLVFGMVFGMAACAGTTEKAEEPAEQATVEAQATAGADSAAADSASAAPTTTPAEATLVHADEMAPPFALELVDGSTFDLQAQRGKVVLVTFWATWCPNCVTELPHLRDEILPRFKGEDFAMVCVSREETNEKIAEFSAQRELTDLPMGADTDRSIYSQYADHTIPRNFVVDPQGKVIFQSVGYEPRVFETMIDVIDQALARGAR